jgi:AcrR family transcriptional regulator
LTVVLRERKKKETEGRIRRAAAEVFKSKGYSDSTMDEIAALADISPGTLYNYYRSKAEIFLSIMTEEMDLIDVEAGRYKPDIEKSIAENIWEYYWKHFKSALFIGKKMWREIMALIMGSSGSFLFPDIAKLDYKFIDNTKLMLDKEKDAGLLPPSFDSGEAAYAAYSVFMIQFLFYLYEEEATLDSLRDKSRRQVEFIFEGKLQQK